MDDRAAWRLLTIHRLGRRSLHVGVMAVIGAMLLLGCTESPEALAARLRRECEAITEMASTLAGHHPNDRERRESLAECILERGNARRR